MQDIGVTLQTAPQPTGGHETTQRPDNGTDRMRNSSRWTGQTGRRALYGRTVCGKWPITSPPVSRVQSPVSNQTRPNTKSNKFLLFSFKNLDQMFNMVTFHHINLTTIRTFQSNAIVQSLLIRRKLRRHQSLSISMT